MKSAATPIAVGLLLAGILMLMMPTVTAAGLIFLGVAAIVVTNIPMKTPIAILAVVVSAMIIDASAIDLGPGVPNLPSVGGLPDVSINGATAQAGG